jgi:hypothetical protein
LLLHVQNQKPRLCVLTFSSASSALHVEKKKRKKRRRRGKKKKKKNETSREPNLVQRTRLELQSSNKRKPDLTTLLSGLASLRMKMRALETVQTAQRSAETTTTMTKNVGVFVVSFSALAPTARHRQ